MDLQGKVIVALEQRKGVSARGEWVSQDFVIETMDSFPRKMVFSVFGADRLQRFGIQVGQMVNVSFDIDAHEYNGRWFNNIRAYDVRPVQSGVAGAQPYPDPAQPAPFAQPAPQQAAPQTPFPAPSEDPDSDLPF